MGSLSNVSTHFSWSSRFQTMKTRIDKTDNEEIQVVVLPPDPNEACDEDEENDDNMADPNITDIQWTVEVGFRPELLEEEQFEGINNIIPTEDEGAST